MKKVFSLLLLIIFLCIDHVYAFWPIYTYPAGEGIVVDAVTKQSIENVLVVIAYEKRVTALFEQTGVGTGLFRLITDKDGKFYFKKVTAWHLLPSWFVPWGLLEYNFTIYVHHPLYFSNDRVVYWWNIEEDKQTMCQQTKGYVNYKIEMVSLEDKFVKPFQNLTEEEKNLFLKYVELHYKFINKEVSGLSGKEKKKIEEEFEIVYEKYKKFEEILEFTVLIGQIEWWVDASYWLELKKLGKKVDIKDIEKIIKIWDSMAEKIYTENINREWKLNRYIKAKETLKENFLRGGK